MVQRWIEEVDRAVAHHDACFGHQAPNAFCMLLDADDPGDDVEHLPAAGEWTELLNSDAAAYGGSGVGNLGAVHADDNGRATMVLPPLGVLWLGRRGWC